jgi:hypothetical protein
LLSLPTPLKNLLQNHEDSNVYNKMFQIVVLVAVPIFSRFDLIDFIVLNATFSNISVISWRPVLVVEEAGVPGEKHRPWISNW